MADDPQTPVSKAEEIQFDRADYVQPESTGPVCDLCREPLRGHYFDINEKMVCERCRYNVEAAMSQRGGAGGFFKAALAGLGVAAVGSAIYYAVRKATGYEFGLISILVGYGVGQAVRWGSRAKGGWVYQSLAIFLTYMAIVSTYVPLLFQEFSKRAEKEKTAVTAPAESGPEGKKVSPPPAKAATASPASSEEDVGLGDAVLGIGLLFLIVLALPFLAGFENLIGLAIIAFGLYEAWKINRRTVLTISGPFQMGTSPAEPSPAP